MVREPTDHRLNYKNGARNPNEHPDGIAEAVSDRFKDATEDLQQRVGQVAEQALQYAEMAQDAVKQFKPFVRKSLKEKPMTTLAGFVMVGLS
jgi:hypothetical protein